MVHGEVPQGEWFSWYSKEKLYVSIGMPPGTEIDATDEVVRKFEEKSLEDDYEKEINSIIMAENARIEISFPSEIEMSYRPYILKEELIQLATNFAGISIYIRGFDPQGYSSSFGTGPSQFPHQIFWLQPEKAQGNHIHLWNGSLNATPASRRPRSSQARWWWGSG